ncbi:phosphotransferase [Kitasatospora phosalacinea]|uniref:phosphotransferase n=1 Tax=Kitasatospora phosalacinea TaxID=2065 RepID=UPI0005261362|nr:phosphotransferase [Kitasatospora phosalacinea]
MDDEERLTGGLANAGAVVRRGAVVERPAPPHAAALHGFLAGLRAGGFAGAPVAVGADWPTEFADPEGGPLLCHNDVCAENVVFRAGGAAALIDFDFAAPGRPVWDVALAARYWVPVLDPATAAETGRAHLEVPRRLALFADAYGLSPADRLALPSVLEQATAVCLGFVARKVAAGDAVFVRHFDGYGGWDRWDRLRSWLSGQRPLLERKLKG